ncbi:putative pentatricopeptide repeat-containing protein At1g56570 [Tripterygium wilfordii]|uniref:putative pentatricopeptide repeat-containing protein At1g56570 n=1 Tax=Tripterygium wilfordii TaxID=458696 RepID=UPI0018F842BD|nr:putative pentatricopeptide repeat-containing protein At1g56570 [Tripterygium wilfordii]
MISRNLPFTTQFHPIPPMIKNALQLAQKTSTQSNVPFLPKEPSILATNLVKSYFDKGLFREARTVFDEMLERDVVAWTAMIAGYTSCSLNIHAWTVFCDMTRSGVNPNEFTMSSVLKACKGTKSLACGALVHGFYIKCGIEGSIYVDNALMDLYATCCINMDDACMIFHGIQTKNHVSWTTMITGYTHRGDGFSGLQVFKQMLLEDAEMNPYSISIAVRACTSISSLTVGKQIHAAVMKHGFESNLPVTNSMLDMYLRCGHLSKANQYFQEMTQKDLITWNTLIAGYERLDPSESLCIFFQMESEGYSPNCFTFTSIIAACANLAVLRCGQQVHGGIFRRGLDGNLALANALIDMYAKCGSITESHNIFGEMSCRNLVSWTSMMIGYGAHGYGKEAVELFDEMVTSGIRPDQIVFMAVLSACSHAGLVDEGLRYFNSMMSDYNITPDQEIYGCVVDLLGRAGRVEEAYQLIQSMPFKPDASVWGALLGACNAHKLPRLGKLAALRLLNLRPSMVGTLVMLSNMYAAEGKWVEFAKMRKLIRGMGSKREAGMSWIEVRNQVYSFVVRDKTSSHIESVYEVLEFLTWHMKEVGYVPDLDCLLHDQEDVT